LPAVEVVAAAAALVETVVESVETINFQVYIGFFSLILVAFAKGFFH
jgi:hypothetical protein